MQARRILQLTAFLLCFFVSEQQHAQEIRSPKAVLFAKQSAMKAELGLPVSVAAAGSDLWIAQSFGTIRRFKNGTIENLKLSEPLVGDIKQIILEKPGFLLVIL